MHILKSTEIAYETEEQFVNLTISFFFCDYRMLSWPKLLGKDVALTDVHDDNECFLFIWVYIGFKASYFCFLQLLLKLEDNRLVETVGIPVKDEKGSVRLTACVSSQVIF